jgi:hypothetical protein
MDNKPIEFESQDKMLEYIKKYAKDKFGYDLTNILKKSELLKQKINQKKISEFF